MSISETLEKLAEKKILDGDLDGAYALISTAEKMDRTCKHCDSKVKGEDKICTKCAKMTKCSLKSCDVIKRWGEMVKEGKKAYCCAKCAKADKKVDRKAFDEMVAKYAGKKQEEEYANVQEDEANKKWKEFQAKGKKRPEDIKPNKKSALETMLAKYAREEWEPTSEEVYGKEVPMGLAPEDDLDVESVNDFDVDPQGSLIDSLQALADHAHETFMQSKSEYHAGMADGIERALEYAKSHLS